MLMSRIWLKLIRLSMRIALFPLSRFDNHNEFSYDPATGDVVLCVATFSEYVTVEDNLNPWEGDAATEFAGGTGTETDPYRIANAQQLAYFGVCVDNGNDFAGKYVALSGDIDLGGEKSFNPIGAHYPGHEKAKNFKGTFDGGIYNEDGELTGCYTIKNLYQNGWELGLSYSNAGGGLFAGVQDATIKNLTMQGADIVMEAVPMGTVASYAYGTCTFDNIHITDSTLQNYNWDIAAIVGGVNGKHTFSNINIDSTVTLSSLWGSFGGGIGGVIGSVYGGHNGNNEITMKNVNVACVLDVYNDVTSAYQWYAYRFCGMLIGNTNEPGADGKNAYTAQATFLKCDNVNVYYGDWVNYHYCQFTNQCDADRNSLWYNNYPWVRVEAGLSNPGYSNARYGHPIVNGEAVVDDNHDCTGEHKMLLKFNQLYGGDQGVYGAPDHDGVTTSSYVYTIQYVNDNKLLAETYVESNTSKYTLASDPNYNTAKAAAEDWLKSRGYEEEEINFGGWMNAASIKLAEIPAENTKNIVLYPYFLSPYTASFVDQQGNILAWCFFNNEDTTKLQATFDKATANLPNPGDDYELINWKISGTKLNDEKFTATLSSNNTNWESFKGYKDITITPHYRYKGADLIEVVDELTGEIDHYQVAGYADSVGSTLVEIPAYVNGKPVTTVNADAFSSYDDLHSVRIPGTITSIGSQSFTADNPDKWGEQRDTVTLYYEGDPAKWNAAMTNYNNRVFTDNSLLKSGWDNMMGEGSCVFFLDENGKVDLSKGYWELADTSKWYESAKFVWQYHNHPYLSNSGCGNEHNNKTDYTADCKCDLGTHVRPDKEYWLDENGNPITAN